MKEVEFVYDGRWGEVRVDNRRFAKGTHWGNPQIVAELLLEAGAPVRLNGTLLEAYDERV